MLQEQILKKMCTKHVISDILFDVPVRELTICLHFNHCQATFIDKCRNIGLQTFKLQNNRPVFWNTAI